MTTPTYPGVYIQELSSGVHTITGVATSIAAFIGWAPQGPVNQPTLVQSWGDFQSQFGGLSSGAYLGYAVNQFFGNGGQQAYIVRLVYSTAVGPPGDTEPATASGTTTTSSASDLTLYASSPGSWADGITVQFFAGADADSFSLKVFDSNGNLLESFNNLSSLPAIPSRYAPTVVDNNSQYISFVNNYPAPTAPPTTAIPFPAPTTSPTPPPSLTLGNGNAGTLLAPTDQGFALQLASGAPIYSVLDSVPIVNIVCVPGLTTDTTDGASAIDALQQFCAGARAFYIVDSPQNANVPSADQAVKNAGNTLQNNANSGAANSAMYFPWVWAPDPLAGGLPALMPPCGLVAGVYAATDASRGVWKAPAGIDAGLSGITGLQYTLTDLQNGQLNPLGVNCLRYFPSYSNVVWGARTLVGADTVGSQWKYVPIRRFALFLESSLYDGTQWVVFEPNDETLWGQIRLNVGAFMQGLFLKRAFQGTTPQQAYFVKCDAENNPQSSINQGIVTVTVGFAPLYPAEFVIIQIQQMMAGLT